MIAFLLALAIMLSVNLFVGRVVDHDFFTEIPDDVATCTTLFVDGAESAGFSSLADANYCYSSSIASFDGWWADRTNRLVNATVIIFGILFALLFNGLMRFASNNRQNLFVVDQLRNLLRSVIDPDQFKASRPRSDIYTEIRDEIAGPINHLRVQRGTLTTWELVYELYISEVAVRKMLSPKYQKQLDREEMLIQVERNDRILASQLEAEAKRYIREAEQARLDREQERWKRTMKSVDELRNTLIQTKEELRNHPSLAHLLQSFESIYDELNARHPEATRDEERMAGMGERIAQQHFRDTYGVNPTK